MKVVVGLSCEGAVRMWLHYSRNSSAFILKFNLQIPSTSYKKTRCVYRLLHHFCISLITLKVIFFGIHYLSDVSIFDIHKPLNCALYILFLKSHVFQYFSFQVLFGSDETQLTLGIIFSPPYIPIEASLCKLTSAESKHTGRLFM